jgi:hypothetical protein
MKKAMCFMFGMAMMLSTSVPATSFPTNYVETGQQKKVEIKVADLPEAIRKALKEDPYAGWTASKAYKIPGPDDTVLYEVQLKKGPDLMKATFDAKGNKIV